MKKLLFMTLTLLLVVAGVNAQKIDQRLTRLVEQVNARRAQGLRPVNAEAVNKTMVVDFNADGSIKALSAIATLKDGAEWPTAQLEQMGIKVRYIVGNQAALVIPADKLMQLEQVEELSYVMADMKRNPANSVARQSTKADISGDATQAVANGLPQAYTGKGVVLGIIDIAIDFNHAAFRNADGTSRVKKAYVCDATSMDEYDVNILTVDNTGGSHGTHTSATAGGSDLGNGMQGVAPEADLVLVGLDEYTGMVNINDGIQRIFAYADEVQKPCVVSISLGNTLGLHDGSDITAKLVAELTQNGTKPGRAVVIGTGNSATNWQSIVRKLDDTTTELKTMLGAASFPTDEEPQKKVEYNTDYYFYAGDYRDFDIQLKVVNLNTGVLSDVNGQVLDKETGTVYNPTVGNYEVETAKGGKAVVYGLAFKSQPIIMKESNCRLVLVVKAKNAGQTINLICDGEGNAEPCFDAPHLDGEYNFAANGYTKGNGDMACNVMICDDAVISVGSYITTTNWKGYQGRDKDYPESPLTGNKQVIGEISDFSSYCVDDNGKPRPTLLAPGQGIISAASNWDKGLFKITDDGNGSQPGVPDEGNKDKEIALDDLISYVDKHGRRNWYVLEQGTSMATPHAAGIVTLWMQAKPMLTVNEIKEIMKETCVNDEFTTTVAKIPSGNKVQAGLGKIDCLAGLKKILNTTGIEAIEAGGHREATPSTMYSVDAPVYNMMGQRVDKSQKGLVIYKGRKYVNK